MQIQRFLVTGLFGRYTHPVPFPTRADSDDDSDPSVVILHGKNGVGKTTILRMLSGMMELDFNVFRKVPFSTCELEFSTGAVLSVSSSDGHGVSPLRVEFQDTSVLLSHEHGGPADEADAQKVEDFRKRFTEAVEGVTIELVEASRSILQDIGREAPVDGGGQVEYAQAPPPWVQYEGALQQWIARQGPRRHRTLARRVQQFIRDAQLDYRRYFRSEPELFPQIMNRLTSGDLQPRSQNELDELFARIQRQAAVGEQLGLQLEDWDYEQATGFLRKIQENTNQQYASVVLATYAEFLASRAGRRQLVVDRLLTFERIMSELLLDKTLKVSAGKGFVVEAADGSLLDESQLSSGEYHLLYLMVSALTTQRRGTVIAIDEPELSLHIAWQRKLISQLLECASNATPQFVFATHSPEIVADYQDQMVLIGE